MPNYKKRSMYQTGGAAKPMPPATMRGMPLATGQRMATGSRTAASQEAERKRQEMIRRDRAMMEVGNRQRAAAMEAARKRAYNQATARTQRPVQGPSRAQASRNRAEYERAMRARQLARSRGSTPARQTVQNLPNYQPRPRPTVQNLPNYQPRNPAPTFDAYQARPVGQVLTPQQLARLRANPDRPNMVNQVQNISQAKAAERSRIQQQIAQLQARLRQLGG